MHGEKALGLLEELRAHEEESEHGWIPDAAVLALRQGVHTLAGQGLVETADRETRAELSAWEGRPVRWAARLSAAGYDLLTYARSRPAPDPSGPGPGLRTVELLPSQMAALRVFVGLGGQLKTRLAQGLAEQVRTAVHDRGAGRWRLHLAQDQMESAAYGFWLHRLTGSAAEANRFGRDYGVRYSPVATSHETAVSWRRK
ncbi:DUF6417 family protein [Streptomyces sp. NPDC002920]